jgi:hypothetical protein
MLQLTKMSLVVVALSCSSAHVFAQDPGQRAERAAIRLGLRGDEARKALGTPVKYRGVTERRVISSQDVGVKGPSSLYDEIYEFQTSLNEYRLTIYYFEDDSESQFHPVPRVLAVRSELDKRVPIGAFARLLEDLPLVAAFCRSECTVAADKQRNADEGTLYLHPKNPTTQETADAEKVRSHQFGQSRAEKPTLLLRVERGAIAQADLQMDECYFEGAVNATWKPPQAKN